MIFDCRPIANEIVSELARKPKPKKTLVGIAIAPGLPTASFLAQKEKLAEKLGVLFVRKEFPLGTPEETVVQELDRLATDENVGGIILQLPLPEEYNRDALIAHIPQKKDVDVLGRGSLVSPPAVGTLIAIVNELAYDMSTACVAIVGKGFLVGEPIAQSLEGKVKKMIVMDKQSFAREKLEEADLVIAGTGVPALIHGEDIRAGAVCIDFGYGTKDGVLTGDFHAPSVEKKASILTPVPGGTGPVLVAKLFENFFTLNA